MEGRVGSEVKRAEVHPRLEVRSSTLPPQEVGPGVREEISSGGYQVVLAACAFLRERVSSALAVDAGFRSRASFSRHGATRAVQPVW